MVSTKLEVWFRVDITLAHIFESSTKTLSVINRPQIGSSTIRYPVLRNISGLGLAIGQSGEPVASSGSITVNDPYESIGEELRIVDLLADHTPIEQTVTVYAAHSNVADMDVESEWVTVWAGKCVGWSKTFGSTEDEITFAVEANRTDIAFRTRSIDAASANAGYEQDYETSSGVGKSLPIVFGSNVYVPCYYAGQSSATTFRYAFATELGTTHRNDVSSIRYYAKSEDGEYRRVYSKTYNSYWGAPVGFTSGANYPTPQGLTQRLVKVQEATVLDYSIIIGGRWWFRGQNNGGLTPAGRIRFYLYESANDDASDTPVLKPIRTAVVEKSDYWSALQGASDFWVYYRWDKPYVWGDIAENGTAPQNSVYVGMVIEQYASSTTDFVDGGVSTTSGTYYYLVGGQGVSDATSGTRPFSQVLSLQFDSSTQVFAADDRGLAAAGTIVTIDAVPTGQENPAINDLDLIVRISGLKDDGSGTISGSAGSVLDTPQEAVHCVSRTWNGSAWVNSASWDHSAYSSRYSTVFGAGYKFLRTIAGYTDGDTSVTDIVGSISREHAGFTVQRTDGKLAWWPWGVYGDAVKQVFTDEQITILSVENLSVDGVINAVQVDYSRQVLNADLKGVLAENTAANNENSVSLRLADQPFGTDATLRSNAIYGEKEPEDRLAQWFSDSTSANTYAEFLLREFDHPHRIVKFQTDFWQYSGSTTVANNLQLMEIVEILSAALPGRLGTCQSARLPTYDGEDVVTLTASRWVRAQRYRCRIIAREIEWNQGENPKLILTARILRPYHPNEVS